MKNRVVAIALLLSLLVTVFPAASALAAQPPAQHGRQLAGGLRGDVVHAREENPSEIALQHRSDRTRIAIIRSKSANEGI